MMKSSQKQHKDRIKYQTCSDPHVIAELKMKDVEQNQKSAWRLKTRRTFQGLRFEPAFTEVWYTDVMEKVGYLAELALVEKKLIQDGYTVMEHEDKLDSTLWDEYNEGQIVLTEMVQNLGNCSKLALLVRLFVDAVQRRTEIVHEGWKTVAGIQAVSLKDPKKSPEKLVGSCEKYMEQVSFLVHLTLMRTELVQVVDLNLLFQAIVSVLQLSMEKKDDVVEDYDYCKVMRNVLQVLAIVGQHLGLEQIDENKVLEVTTRNCLVNVLLVHRHRMGKLVYDKRSDLACGLFLQGIVLCELWSPEEQHFSSCAEEEEAKLGMEALLVSLESISDLAKRSSKVGTFEEFFSPEESHAETKTMSDVSLDTTEYAAMSVDPMLLHSARHMKKMLRSMNDFLTVFR